MSLFARMATFFGAGRRTKKSHAEASFAGQLTMADAQLKQQGAVQKMRRGVADVSVSRQRLDLQAADLAQAMDSLAGQAEVSRDAGDEGAAQTAMNRHLIMGGQLADLISQRDALAEQENMLIAALTQLQARVAGFNVTAETLKATHKAADANQSIAQALAEFTDDEQKLPPGS